MSDTLMQIVPTLNAFFGAGLGAAFYILLSTREYLVNRTYDPKYNAVYVARFITGLVAGVILATALGPGLIKATGQQPGLSLTPGILAILGGFAADAVQQILQRVVEVLLAVVQGDGSADAQIKARAAAVDQNAQATSKLLEFERETDPTRKQALLSELFALFKTTST